jgi:ubiquinone/menaquinone biosynthesis C-methylase UbiE
MGCHGGFSLDEATRREWYNPEGILQMIGLRHNMVFIDIGCGDGFFSILAAKIVGKTGKVYALDVDSSAIENLNRKAKANNLKNIIAIVGKAEETVFCNNCADLLFFSMVLHDFYDPSKVLQNSKQMVKTSGLLIDLDWKKQEMPFGPPTELRLSELDASNLIQTAGFNVDKIIDVGPYHYLLIAKNLK